MISRIKQIQGPKGYIRGMLFRAICSRAMYDPNLVAAMLVNRGYTWAHGQVLRNLVTLERSYVLIQESA